ncbi:MAG: CHASE2 domain-containing protein [Cyanobacteria bacterium P01_D01_bin.1]
MDRRVTLKLNQGSLSSGFSVTLLMGDGGPMPSVDIFGRLPAAPHLQTLYRQWQRTYRHLGATTRLEPAPIAYQKNVSLLSDCREQASELCDAFDRWLQADSFRCIRDKLLEKLNAADTVRLVLQTEPGIVQRLPWHLWELCDRYPRLEITLSPSAYEKNAIPSARLGSKIRILAIIGQSQGIDLRTDKDLLNRLPNAEVCFLTEPNLKTLSEALWDAKGWDILFFAGHSATKSLKESIKAALPNKNLPAGMHSDEAQQADPPPITTEGELYVSEAAPLILSSLENPLKKAVANGLKIAIFNSCDGLGLAYALAEFKISQIVVMREPVPDRVAHTFLKFFLETFSRGESLALSVRDAREKLQILESEFPCASWLPALYQNPAEAPPTWQTLRSHITKQTHQKHQFAGAAYLLATALVLIFRALGGFQSMELRALDLLLRLRPHESPDNRIALITVDDADLLAQDPEDRRGSLSDSDLHQLLTILNPMAPRTIGLDIYRDFPVRKNQPELKVALESQENLFGVCKSRDDSVDSKGIPPPPEMTGPYRTGFSDYLTDPDGIVRKQLLSMQPDPASPCKAKFGLAMMLASHYLLEQEAEQGIEQEAEQGIEQGAEQGLEQEAEQRIVDFDQDNRLIIGDLLQRPFERGDGGYVNSPDQGWQTLLNYRSLPKLEDIAEQISLTEILSGQVDPESIRDRIVIIGSTASGFDDDRWLTPYSQGAEETTRGIFVQAHMVSQLISAALDGRPLIQTWPRWADMFWILGWSGGGSLLMVLLGRDRNHFLSKLALSLLVSQAALFGICWLLLSRAYIWVPWVPAAIAPVAVAGTTLVLNRVNPTSASPPSHTNYLPKFSEIPS